MRPHVLILIALSSLSIAAPAFAQEEGEVRTVHVSMAGLDLASPEGAAMALSRIRDAASTVCGDRPDPHGLETRAYDRCIKQAVDGAVSRLGRPLVTRAASTGPAPVVLAAR
jgi:UrcA family protein